jgi:hypothetical protein
MATDASSDQPETTESSDAPSDEGIAEPAPTAAAG